MSATEGIGGSTGSTGAGGSSTGGAGRSKSRTVISGTWGSTTRRISLIGGIEAASASGRPVGSPRNSISRSHTALAVETSASWWVVQRRLGWPASVMSFHKQVQRPRDAGSHLPGRQHRVVLVGSARDDGVRRAGPGGGECAVEDPAQVLPVLVEPPGGQTVEGGVDAEPDQPDRTEPVDEHVLGVQPAVGDAARVRGGDGAGDLGGQPGRPARAQRAAVGDQDVEGGAGAPLVDDEAAAVAHLGVEHPQDPGVEDGGRLAGGGEQQRRARVVLGDHVERDEALQDVVMCTPEAPAGAFGQQVDQPIAAGQYVAWPRRRRQPPSPSRSGQSFFVRGTASSS